MSDEVVTKDLLFYVADILVDELAQNAAVASDTKRRLRSCVENLSAFITSARPNGDANQAKGTKRKDADRAAADMPEAKAQATVTKKVHKTSMHSVFISYGAHALPERMQEIRDKLLGKSRTMETLNKYYKSLPKSTLHQFEDTYKPFLDDYNDLSKKPQMKTLAMRLKQYDQEQGSEMHPVFDGFMKFVEEEAALLAQGGQKPAAVTPAEDSSEGEAEKPAKTPPVIKSATKVAAKTSTGKAAAKASPPAVAAAPSKKAVTAKAAAAAKAPPAKGKAVKAAAAKKAAEVLESSTGEEDSSDDDVDGDDNDEDDEDDDGEEEEESE